MVKTMVSSILDHFERDSTGLIARNNAFTAGSLAIP